MENTVLNDLKRAYEMEERMAGVLIDLCEPAITDADSGDENVRKIHRILLGIQRDTLKHKEIVLDMLTKLSKGQANG